MADLDLIKQALERAVFDRHEIRELIYRCIGSVENDLEEVGFGASMQTDEAFEELQRALSRNTRAQRTMLNDDLPGAE